MRSNVKVRRTKCEPTIQIVVIKSIVVVSIIDVSVIRIVALEGGIVITVIAVVRITITEIAEVGIAVAVPADLDGHSSELGLRDTAGQQDDGA